MAFDLIWQTRALEVFEDLTERARKAREARGGKGKSTRAEGLFKQVVKCVQTLAENPRHPGLQTHAFNGLEHPYVKGEKVFEAYVQNQTPGAYRVFWCYGRGKGEITVIAITAHP